MEEKKDNKNKVIIALVIVTILILIVGIWAFARYTSKVAGSGTASVAAWSFKVNGQNETITENIDLLASMNAVNGKVAPNHMAPGTSGSFNVDIDATGSDVAVEYNIELSNFSHLPKNLKFYTDENRTNPLTVDADNKITASGYIPYNKAENAMKTNATIYWDWAYQTGTTANEIAGNDEKDTLDAGQEITCDVSVTGWQSNPNTEAPTNP